MNKLIFFTGFYLFLNVSYAYEINLDKTEAKSLIAQAIAKKKKVESYADTKESSAKVQELYKEVSDLSQRGLDFFPLYKETTACRGVFSYLKQIVVSYRNFERDRSNKDSVYYYVDAQDHFDAKLALCQKFLN